MSLISLQNSSELEVTILSNRFIDNFEDIEKYLLKNCINGDLLITMGAGDVYKIGEDLLK